VASRLCKKRQPNNSSIFSVEARVILLALDMDISLMAVSSCSVLTLCHAYKVFKIETFHALSLSTFYVACMVYYQVVTVLFLCGFLVMLDWQVTRRRYCCCKLMYSYQCLILRPCACREMRRITVFYR